MNGRPGTDVERDTRADSTRTLRWARRRRQLRVADEFGQRIHDLLWRPVRKGDWRAARARVADLRAAFESIPPEHRGRTLQRLTNGDLAPDFKYRLSTLSRNALLRVLGRPTETVVDLQEQRGTHDRSTAVSKRLLERVGQVSVPTVPQRKRTPVPTQRHTLAKLDLFPHIRDKRRDLYHDAIKAWRKYDKVKDFLPYYWNLTQAAYWARIKLDSRGNCVVSPERASFIALLSGKLTESVIDQFIGKAKNFVIGKALARQLGLLEILHSVWKGIDCRRLAKEPRKESGRAFDKKLSFFMDVVAADLARKNPGRSRVGYKNWLIHQYYPFKRVFWEWQNYLGIENSLNPDVANRPPSFRAP